MKNLAELLVTTDTESHILESDTGYIYDRLIEAVQEDLFATQLLALRIGPSEIHGKSIDLELVDRNSLGIHANVAQGAEIPFGTATISEITVTPSKYGVYPLITEEMLEDGKFSMMDLNVKETGYQMARTIEEQILLAVETGADANTVAHNGATTAFTIAGLCSCFEFLEADGYKPTDIIVQSSEAKDIRQIDSFHESDKSGGVSPQDYLIGTMYGAKVWQSENVATSGDALVLDRRHALALVEKRPITVKGYDATTRDCRGIVATMRMAASYLRKEACCTYTVT